MTASARATQAEIRSARTDNPEMGARELASQLGISEAELVAAACGATVRWIRPDIPTLLEGLAPVGNILSVASNPGATHRNAVSLDKVAVAKHSARLISDAFGLRIFPSVWVHAFAVQEREGSDMRRSLQFFDAHGDAVCKLYEQPSSDRAAFGRLEEALMAADQTPGIAVAARAPRKAGRPAAVPVSELRARWSAMKGVHQLSGILSSLSIGRRQALQAIGRDYAWPLERKTLLSMIRTVADKQIPIKCFVSNEGCVQSYTGLLQNAETSGEWLDLTAPAFGLHLALDRVHDIWAVRKPNIAGHATSLEAYDEDGELIVVFYGERTADAQERDEWRTLIENMQAAPDAVH